MNVGLIQGDHVSCSRVGGAMRRESSRLRQRAEPLQFALEQPAASDGPDPLVGAVATVDTLAHTLRALRHAAECLDRAGAAQCGHGMSISEPYGNFCLPHLYG